MLEPADSFRGASRLKALVLPLVVMPVVILAMASSVHASEADSQRSVIVTSGDTFTSVALREFGSSAFGRLIAEYNGQVYGKTLRTGDVIRIPVTMTPGNESTQVVFAKGDPVVYLRGDTRLQRRIKVGTSIFANDVIKTDDDGYVSLQVPSGTTISVQPNSTVQLVELDCKDSKHSCVVELNALEGAVNSRVRRRNGQPAEFTVRTPHAMAAVRGTVFDVNSSSAELLVGVTEGELDLQAQGKGTSVSEGLGVKTLAGQPPGPPIALLAIPSFRRLPARRMSIEDTVGWYPLDNADRYLLSVYRDELNVEVAYQALLSELEHQIPALEPGRYYLNLRGIDANGLKGYRAQVPFLMTAFPDEVGPGPTLIRDLDSGSYIVSVENAVDADADYELQLSTTQDFLEVTSVDVTGDGGMVFQPVDTPFYVRARQVNSELSVGPFGPVLELPLN